VAANVTVNGYTPRQWSLPGGTQWGFEAELSLPSGASNVTLTAANAAGAVAPQRWSVQSGGEFANFTYDANGAMVQRVNDPGNTTLAHPIAYTWDGIGRLLSVQDGNTTVTFGYDGLGRRISLSANISGNVTNEYYLWDGDEIVQKRTGGTGSTNITRNEYSDGFQTMSGATITGNYFYTKDHLGSIREVVANNGTTVEGRYSYGPFGETVYTDLSGGNVSPPDFGYDGYFRPSAYPALYLTKYRAYDPTLTRWLSRDPSGEGGGLNLYGYAYNDPINFTDLLGLSGTLVVCSSGTTGIGNHAWISYTPDGGKTTTYGTWGNNPTGAGNGLFMNLELGRGADATRSAHLNDNEEKELYNIIKNYIREGQGAWTYGSACSSFAANSWNGATGEHLSPYWGPISNPASLTQAITDANGGVPNGTATPGTGSSSYPGSSSQSSSGSSASSVVSPSGSSLHKSGSL
jgi:RHS repeat-associated protein